MTPWRVTASLSDTTCTNSKRVVAAQIAAIGNSGIPHFEKPKINVGLSVEDVMGLILLVLLLALIFGGLGFALHWLWIIAVVLFIAWLVGFAFRSGTGSRWYRW